MPFERVSRVALTVALIVACDRSQRDNAKPASSAPVPSSAAPAAAPAPAQATNCPLAAIPTKLPLTPKRLVAIGDLHGDLGGTRAALRAAGAIDVNDKWSGGELVIVQTGDILDRGDDESKIYELLERLQREASAAGGAIVLLNGNHELMNTARDFRYVTPGGMRDFGGDRQAAFDPGKPWAVKLARYNVVAIVADTVFSHAGVTGEWATQLDALNLESRCWLAGHAGGANEPPAVMTSNESPVWTRAWGVPAAADCANLDGVLAKLGAKRMVVGHTVQDNGITTACDGKLWRIDVGLAAAYGGPIQVLELVPAPKVLTGTR